MKRRPFLRRVRSGERGAIATIFTVVLAGGVVMGMLALTIDVGNIMFERRQLQNGADATSLALASECGNDPASCSPDDVQDLLGANAKDDTAQYDVRTDAPDGACGRGNTWTTLTLLPPCDSITLPAPIEDLTECPPLPDWLATGAGVKIPYVETYSRTLTDDGDPATGDTILPKYFSQLLVGGGPDSSVTACARAAWGPPGAFTASIPLTISACEWKSQTSDGTDWVTAQPEGPKPGYGAGTTPWPDADREIVINLHDPGDEDSDCDWNGKDTAGGFGWVDGPDCKASVSTDKWVNIDTGADTPSDCKDILPGLVGTTVSIPVFNCIVNSKDLPVGNWESWSPVPDCDPTTKASGGANSWYYIEGWARFYVSGYQFSGATQDSIMPGGHTSCPGGGGDRCLFGWFLKGELDADLIMPPDPSDPDFGTFVVLPAG